MRTYTLILILLAAILSSCAPRHPKDVRFIDSLRVEAEEFIRAQSLMGYQNWATGSPSNQDSLYRAHDGLFTKVNIEVVTRAEREEGDALQAARFRYFRRYLILEYLGKETASLTDDISTFEAEATVTVGDHQIPYRQIQALLANEPSQGRRSQLYSASDRILDSLNSSYARIADAYHRLAAELGYSSYDALVEDVRDFSLTGMRDLAERTLSSTDSLYTALLNEMVPRYLRIPPAEFHRYDAAPLFRNLRFDTFFPGSQLLQSVRSTYRSMGFDLAAQNNLVVDAEQRPLKNPRAVCFAIEVPHDIRISVKPMGGFDDYAALFHEMGHGQHYANTRENAFEFKYLGEPTVTETYAFLSEYLLANQAWLRLHSRMSVAVLKDYIRFQAFYRLYYVRRYCAKLLYELQFHSSAAEPQKIYSSTISRALGYRQIPSDEKRYLADMDAHYYSAGYLRAWFLEARLNSWLSRTYGANWFENPESGVFLRSLWAKGDRLTGHDLAAQLGDPEITPEAWSAEIRDMIRLSSR